MFSFFKKFRKKKIEEPDELDEKALLEEYRRKREKQLEKGKDRLAVEICEDMIEASRELENIRDEYRLVTSYLTDIQTIEDLPSSKRAELIETAEHLLNLNKVRDELLVTENRISDVQFSQMQEEEDQIPRAVKRLEENETFLNVVSKDLHTLEGEKLSINIEMKECKKELRSVRNISIWLIILFATLLALYFALTYLLDLALTIPMVVITFLIVILGAYCLIRYQDCQRDIKQGELNLNRAIELENHIKIKYVNIKNAVDYSCEKYHVNNSRELVYIYEQYQATIKERQKFKDANDDLAYYNQKLVRQLSEYRLYDAQVWVNYAHAICDPREMVEVKHNLIVRRQKLRTRMEYNISALNEMRDKALMSLDPEDKNRERIEEIIRRLDEINQGAAI